jgi:hypothetical protein
LSSLTELVLDFCPSFTNDAFACLSDLRCLESLSFHNCFRLHGRGFRFLHGLPRLFSVTLSDCPLNDAGAKQICLLPVLTRFTYRPPRDSLFQRNLRLSEQGQQLLAAWTAQNERFQD